MKTLNNLIKLLKILRNPITLPQDICSLEYNISLYDEYRLGRRFDKQDLVFERNRCMHIMDILIKRMEKEGRPLNDDETIEYHFYAKKADEITTIILEMMSKEHSQNT